MKACFLTRRWKDGEKTKQKRVRHRARPELSMSAKIGVALLVFHTLVAIVGPFFASHPPDEILNVAAFAPAGEGGPLGTDYLGRDLLSRMLYGARLTIGIAIITTIAGYLIGMTLGFVAAESGGSIDNMISRVVDIVISFPPILLALVVIAGLGSSIPVLIATVAVIHTPRVARVSRAVAMDVAANEFVEIARARGEGLWSILLREIWPNTVRPLAAEFGLRLTFCILFLSSLSFLGLGIQPPAADWGIMVRENLSGLSYGSWAALLPAAAISSITVGINLFVDWMGAQTGGQISEEMLR